MRFIAGIFPSHIKVLSRHIYGALLLLAVSAPSIEAASQPYVHYFSCDQCHYAGMPYYEVNNVCLNCHTDGKGTAPIMDNPPPGVDGTTEGLFLPGDASNVGGNNPALKDYETSHNWYAPTDTRPEFGASAPLRNTENRFFYSRYGTSTGKITCSRCHLPHAYTNNPQLLVMGPDSADKMCQACHRSWVLDEHGWLTHPIIDNYNASVSEYPDKYRPILDNKEQSDVKLVEGGVSCTSCHGVHFADSDSTTTDGHSNLLSQSDGKLLRSDGPDRADKSALCQTCHTYQEHGDNTGEKVGCMVCHSGHSYAPDFPNYYVLRKSATTTTYNTVTGLNYGSTDGQKSDYWNDGNDGEANGYCERCHGDAKDIGAGAGNYHAASAVCTDCHSHANSSFGHGDGSVAGSCEACHGHDAGYEYESGKFSQGKGTFQSHSTHTEIGSDDIKGPNIGCDSCHNIAKFPMFRSKDDPNAELTLEQTDVCDTCHSPGGPFDGVNDNSDDSIGAKSIWSTGAYTGTDSSNLITGKEQWCVGCHDSEPSVIGGWQAPDVAGNNTSYGYYLSGHGTFSIECDGCHNAKMAHIDGKKTYVALSPQNYKEGYRLSDVEGEDPLLIPATNDGCNYNADKYRLCFSCHSEQNLLQEASPTSSGCSDPFYSAATTGFRDLKDPTGTPYSTNLHWQHLNNFNMNGLWDSDSDGVSPWDSEAGCITCHNPHSEPRADNTPTVRMTKSGMGISAGSDGNGPYGEFLSPSFPCAICHASPSKYYRTPPTPAALNPPNKPSNENPAPGSSNLLQPQTLESSAFDDPDIGDTHKYSQWLISSVPGNYADHIIYDSGFIAGSESHLPQISWTSGDTYYWKVRYRDNRGLWSGYSDETSFTILTNEVPSRPTQISPVQGAMNVDRRPVAVASPFTDADNEDSHEGVEWQINDTTDFSGVLTHSSGDITPTTNPGEPHTVSYAVPDQLGANRVYYWRVRYKDSKGQWSEFSEVTSFTTSSLITKFEFEDDSASSTASDSEEDNDGAIVGGATWTTGLSGQGLSFDGTSGEMSWEYNNEVPQDTFTMEAMVKATTTHQIDAEAITGTAGASGQKYVFGPALVDGSQTGAGVSVGVNGISVYEGNSGFLPPVAVYNPATKTPEQPLLGTGWNHVVVTYTETQPRIYLNGRLVHTGLNSSRTDVFAPILLGHSRYGYTNGIIGAFTGTIDEVAIYNKALTKTEVLQRCLDLGQCTSADIDNDGVTDSDDNCPVEYNPDQADHNNNGLGNVCDYLGFWKLNEGSGETTADEAGRYHAPIGYFEHWTPGVGGGSAFAGNGSFNYVEVDNLLDNYNGDFSISFWQKFPTGTTNPRWSLTKGDPWGGIGFGIAHWVDTDTDIPPGLFLNDGTPGAAHRVSLYASSIPRDTWGHFTWTVDRANHVMKVYKNGGYEASVDISILGTNAITREDLFEFATSSSQFTGALDNVAVYDFVLQPNEVLARYENDLNVTDAAYSISLADNDSNDPAAAEVGYTNDRSVTINTSYVGAAPTEMEFAEDISFTSNATGWLPFSSTHTYLLTAGDGTRTVYGRLRTADGEISPLRATIVLDTISPAVSSNALTRPNGAETWIQGASEEIIWTPEELSDTHIKDAPVSLAYSTDGGATFDSQIVIDETNDGSYLWDVAVEDSTTVKVQLTATDKAGNQSSDNSDADFEITPVTPVLLDVSVTDNNNADPAPAEAGYTNKQSVEVSLSVSNFPTQMLLAEDSGFSINSTGWIPYSSSYTYNLTSGDGSMTVYAKLRNAAPGESAVLNDTIVLDTVAPYILADTLTSPNGHATNRWQAEFLTKGTNQTISWSNADIADTNLKTNPVFLRYATDQNGPWLTTIAGNEGTNVGEANDGAYLWNVDADYSHYARIQLAVRDKAGNEATDISNDDFNISPLPQYIVTNANQSGAGSLRQALTDLQAAGGNSPVWFDIPGTSLTNGVAVINSATELPWLLAGSIVDGTSQTVLRGDTNPNGPEARVHYTGAANINGLTLSGDSSAVRDLQITRFYTGLHITGANTAVEGCQFGFFSDSTGYVSSPNSISVRYQNGSVSTVTDNYFACSNSGVSLSGTPGVRVESNIFGLLPDGSACSTSFGINMSNSGDVEILNNIIISNSRGISTSGYNNNTGNVVIQGNQIGSVFRDGIWTDLPGPGYGIYIDAEYGNGYLIGGPSVANSDSALYDSNVISADDVSIYIKDVVDYSTEIHGNFIGTNPEQDETFSGGTGVIIGSPYLYGLKGITVGGDASDEAGNVIANMSQYGIAIEVGTSSNSREHVFSRNSFYNNGNNSGDDAIYLNPSGNGSISRPVAILTPDNELVINDVYGGYSETTGDIIEVYIADSDGTEYGEGKEFITSAQASGAPTSITIALSQLIADGVVQQGDWLTITKTNVFNGTTAFSENVRLTGATAPELSLTEEPGYDTDGVNPDSGAQPSTFTFRVKYTDADNDSPWPIEVWIDIDDDGSYTADEKFALAEVEPTDTDYTDGKLYTYSSSPFLYVGDGILNYRFYASDAKLDATGAPMGDKTFEITNDPPVTPSNITPLDAASGVMQPPVLSASNYTNTPFDEIVGDYHEASQWLVSSVAGDFSAGNILYNSGTFIASESHDASFAWAPNTTYHWKVRYQDNHGAWSAYSTDTSFTTFNNSMPGQPTNDTPAPGTVNVDLQPTLIADAYFDTDFNAHQASTWQVSFAGGARFGNAIVYNSVTGPVTWHTVTTPLTENNRYYWRVRYHDSAGQRSAWSSPTEFFVPTSLVTMITFNNDSGVVAEDVYGGYNGAVLNGALWSTGFSGQGLTFDGTDDQVLLSYAGGTPPANNFTIEAMVKATSTHQIDTEATGGSAVGTGGQNYLFGANFAAPPDAGAGVSLGTNGISVYEHSDGYMPAVAVYDPASKDPAQPQLGTGWNHVVVSYTDKQTRIYLNGQLVHTGLTSPRTNVFAPTKLGSGSYGAFAGIVDEVSVYNSALTDTEVMQHCLAVGQCPSADIDSDGVTDSSDNCLFDYNPGQNDEDNDGVGNACDPLGAWNFDEGSGTIAQDATGYNNDGQLIGGTTWTTGKVGSAVDLDGVTGNISIADTPDHHFGTGSFTIETWINASSFTSTDAPTYARWFSKSTYCPTWETDPSCKWFVGQINSTGHPMFGGRGYNDPDGFGHTASGTISLDTWHHIAYVIDRSGTPAKGFIYIDGVNQSGTGVEFPLLSGELNIPASITLGGPHADLTGKLDQTVIYNSALSTAEILGHYQSP